MTDRLYYTDAYLTTFDGTVTRVVADGAQSLVVLDRTAFYPTSGGQPHDLGTLNGLRVVDVRDEEDGIHHVVEGPLPVGATVHGAIDWPRRFDHMQQHTGQHVLSAAFASAVGAETVGVHFGEATATIDLARELTPAAIQQAEAFANQVIWDDRPIAVRFVTAEQARTLPLRKESAREGTLRLIEIPDCDLSACGGTHVARTGSVGIIAVTGWEKVRGGTRVEFVCGGRVAARFGEWRDVFTAIRRHVSLPVGELAAGIERLQAEQKAQGRLLGDVQTKLAAHEGRALAARAARVGAHDVVIDAVDGDAAAVRAMASAAVQETPIAVVLFSRTSPATVVVARHAQGSVDARAVVQALVAVFGGKGGGKPDLAQAGGLQGDTAALVAAATNHLGNI